MAKLISCKVCNSEISSSAKVCPKCGEKIKKPFYKKVWFWIIVIVLLVCALSNNDNISDDDSSITSNNSVNDNSSVNNSSASENVIEYLSVDTDTLKDELNNNAAAVKEKYNGKYLEITGRLSTIDSDLKYISIVSVNDKWDIVGVHCTLKNSSQKEVVKSLSRDETIIVRGKITDVGEVLGYYLDVIEIVKN